MRPRLVEYIESCLDSSFAAYLVPTGTTMYVVTMLVVMYIYVKRCEQTRLSAYHALGSCIYGIIGGLAGARIFYLIETLPVTIENPEVILNLFGGTTSWGVYIGGFSGFFLYLKFNHIPLLMYADVMGSSLGLGPFIGRWSCFLHGCCYGHVADFPWAIQYPDSSPAFYYQVKLDLLPADASLSLPVHPLPVYLSFSALIVFFMTTRLWRRFRAYHGLIFILYWILYCSSRFILEFFRENAPRFGYFQFDMGQIMCLLIVSLAGVSAISLYRKKPNNIS